MHTEREQAIRDCIAAVEVPYTMIDGYPFVLMDEINAALRALLEGE